MYDLSARLELPFLQPSQAQKHVTHNLALQRLDALVQMVLEATEIDTPPGAPENGELWAIGSAPTGDWAGQAGQLAQWVGSDWVFIAPQVGWRAWDRAANMLKTFENSAWTVSADTQNLPGTGINATWDITNRLSVASNSTLFSHDGTGHQLKLNKATTTDTASLLYQTNFTGHAEMGLTGNDDFSIKVSADGNTWTNAMIVDSVTGVLTGAAVQNSATDTGAGKLARADYVYGPGNLLGTVSTTGGVPDGAVIESGSNANGWFTKWADGTVLCGKENFRTSQIGGTLWLYPMSFASEARYIGVAPEHGVPIVAHAHDNGSKKGVTISAWNLSSTRVVTTVSLISIGRWF